jgi:uncharacterized protein (TIGR03437 family)
MIRALVVLLLSHAAFAQQYVISTVAGGAPPVTPASAPAASIGDPPKVATDSSGNTYFGSLHCIFKVDRTGSLTRIAGNGRNGISGDGGPALSAQLSFPDGIAVDAAGVVYYTEHQANRIRRIDTKGIITTLASGDLKQPAGLALDGSGNLYVADTGNNMVRRVAADGTLVTVAGTGAAAWSGDGGPAPLAALNGPEGVAFDSTGNLYIADTFNHLVRIVTPDGNIATFAGTGLPAFGGDDGPATAAALVLPTDVATDAAGNVYIADLGNSRIRKVAKGTIGTVAGASAGPFPLDGLAAKAVRLSGPTGIAVDSAGTIYFAEGSIGSGSGLDDGVFHVWKVTGDGKILSAAGNGLESFSGDSGPAAVAQMHTPAGVALDLAGNLYFSDSQNHRVRKISTDGTITTVAGNVLPGYSGDGGPAITAELNNPTGLAVDTAGNLYIADTGNNRIREVFANGVIGTLAGNGNAALFGDRGSSTLSAIHAPRGVAVDASGTIFIADTGNHCIRKVSSGVITTVGCGFNAPSDVKVDDAGNVWVADDTLILLTDAGRKSIPVAGPLGLALDAAGKIYASDANGRIVTVAPDGTVTAIAGNGICCYAGDGGPAAAAQLDTPWGIALDLAGDIFVADSGNNAIREITSASSTFFIRAVTNSASNVAGPLAPGEVVTIYGAGLGPANLVVNGIGDSGALSNSLAGTNVLFNGTAAPLLYVSAGQLSAVVPYGVTGPNVAVTVQLTGPRPPTAPFTLPLAAAAPGLFTQNAAGTGPANATNQDGSLNSASHPAATGSLLTLLMTGEGQTNPVGADGKAAGATPPRPVLPVAVTIGGKAAAVQSAAGVPGVVAGVMAVTMRVPDGVTGQTPVVVTVGGISSQPGVTVSVQ